MLALEVTFLDRMRRISGISGATGAVQRIAHLVGYGD